MVFEVYALKKIFFFYPENTYTVSIALSSFLAGLGFSGIICAQVLEKKPTLLKPTLILLISSFTLYGMIVLNQTPMIPRMLDMFVPENPTSDFTGLMKGLFLWIYLFVPAFLIGGSFPLLISANIDKKGHPYLSTGIIYFLDIIGGAVGSLMTGVFLIPNYGMQMIPIIIGAIGCLSLFIISYKSLYSYILIIITLLFYFDNKGSEENGLKNEHIMIEDSADLENSNDLIYNFPDTAAERQSLNREALKSDSTDILKENKVKEIDELKKPEKLERKVPFKTPAMKNKENQRKSKFIAYNDHFGEVIYQEPSPYGVVTIGEKIGVDESTYRGLFINYRDMCWSKDNFSETQLGRLTSANLNNFSLVLNIGLGCGFTAQSLAESSKINLLEIVEINPVVVEACKKHFSNLNGNVLESPKVKLLVENGAEYVRKAKNSYYDAIVIDIEEPGVIQSSPMYTAEYAEIIKEKLRPDGIFTLWAVKGNEKYNEILFHTLSTVFEFVVFRNDDGQAQLYAASRKLDIEDQSKEEWRAKIPSEQIINTLENRALEKSYSIQKSFSYPETFKDPFVREN